MPAPGRGDHIMFIISVPPNNSDETLFYKSQEQSVLKISTGTRIMSRQEKTNKQTLMYK